MTESKPNPSPFERLHAAYAGRHVGAAICVALAAGGARLLYASALPAYWVVELITVCLAGSLAGMLFLELLQRRRQLQQVRIVEDAANPYGFAGAVPPAEASTRLATPPSGGRKRTTH